MGKKFSLKKIGISNPLKSPLDYLLAPVTGGASLIQYNDKGILESGTKKVGDFLFGKKPDANNDQTWAGSAKAQATRLNDAATGNGESIAVNALRESQKTSLGNALAGISTIGGISPQLKNRLAQNQTAIIGSQTKAMEDQVKLEEKAQNEALLSQHLAQMQGTQLTDQQTAMAGYNTGAQSRLGFAKGVGSALIYANKNMKTQQAQNAPATPIGDYQQLPSGQYYG